MRSRKTDMETAARQNTRLSNNHPSLNDTCEQQPDAGVQVQRRMAPPRNVARAGSARRAEGRVAPAGSPGVGPSPADSSHAACTLHRRHRSCSPCAHPARRQQPVQISLSSLGALRALRGAATSGGGGGSTGDGGYGENKHARGRVAWRARLRAHAAAAAALLGRRRRDALRGGAGGAGRCSGRRGRFCRRLVRALHGVGDDGGRA